MYETKTLNRERELVLVIKKSSIRDKEHFFALSRYMRNKMREISFIIIWLKKKLFCLCIHSTLVGHPLGKILIYSNIPEICSIVHIVVLRLAFVYCGYE